MSTLELKLSLIEQVTQIDDEQLLNEIMDLINKDESEKNRTTSSSHKEKLISDKN